MDAQQSTSSAPPAPRPQHADDEDSISYRSICLDDCAAMPEWDDEHWDFGASFLADLDSSHVWNDTLERQHFGPLKDLLTTGGTKADGHNFISITLMHPTWCDKCGDFIWGLLKQACKCEKCNYTCHSRCRELVTLDCRSAGSSLSSGEFPSMYPKLLDGTLGTIPKDLHLPPIPLSPFGDSDKENDTGIENPLFSPMKSPRPDPLSALGHPVGEQLHSEVVNGLKTLQISEVYVKEDTPFEWSPAYRDEHLAESIAEYNKTSEGLSMKMNDDGETFTGLIQIHMNLTRPISVVAGEKPPSVYDVVNTGGFRCLSLINCWDIISGLFFS
ncbi:phorbol esters/diacylglycerol binding domain protein [Oesophagostomum dentatum]|uniref:Phorbol esters/diacylglycerol binding domain protein n=1 Tax=Oesophagostomum dentatum TaxID=61180 RepID=A0A0B1TM14_OESDE|nr:phorbol esters/diacylglycerol binding domain protein [Oesophagostomum dentatum]